MKKIVKADLFSQNDAIAVVGLLNEYAKDEMGGNQELSDYAKNNLVKELRNRPHCTVFLASLEGSPAGLAICFEMFSTFQCRPILNIHDFVIAPDFRGQGLSQELLSAVEIFAKESSCCKLTLEVLQGNQIARKAYQNFGFRGYQLDTKLGQAMFYEKTLGPH